MKRIELKGSELTDEQMDGVTGGIDPRMSGYSCASFDTSDAFMTVMGGLPADRNHRDCINCRWWDPENYHCVHGFHAEPRYADPEWEGN